MNKENALASYGLQWNSYFFIYKEKLHKIKAWNCTWNCSGMLEGNNPDAVSMLLRISPCWKHETKKKNPYWEEV